MEKERVIIWELQEKWEEILSLYMSENAVKVEEYVRKK